eukprot:gnl/TRDRNA2_/TRDRNA2_190603_c0_seq1.p1 gnl/TRDRNA2_/TRDRNA2_190603_c0~~gnl/TRDRNA2_/TRDRNA2_190603_c0_seq1.p1  ORF type:complete len:249 (+),score=72.11 gnl/TRDRNA2_/TRDRNA2_190603_c0_seq1:76-822(+)
MLSPTTDPYHVAREEVSNGLKKVNFMLKEWERILLVENTAQSGRFKDLKTEILGELRQLEYDLQDVNTTAVQLVEENRDKYPIDDRELNARKAFVKESQAAVKKVQASLSSPQALAKIENDRREALLAESQQSARAQERLAAEDNAAFMRDQRQEQMQLLGQQDQQLAGLAESTKRLNQTAHVISDELQVQQRLLDDLGDDIDQEKDKFEVVVKRVGKLLKTDDRWQIYIIIGLTCSFIILLLCVIYG